MFLSQIILSLCLLLVPMLHGPVLPIHTLSLAVPAEPMSSLGLPMNIQKVANDPLFANQRSLVQIKAPGAWEITTGNRMTIALIDTGVAIHHEDLSSQLWSNPGEIPDNNRDDDGNGYIDDIHGYNFYQNNTDISDQNGHGTGIASIIAASTNNAKGMAGINWRGQIMVLKALNSLGGGEYSDVAQAVRYAVENGASLINMSFGTYLDNVELKQAVDYAISNNVAVVAAAGNNGQNKLLYPAAYADVIAVGAVDGSDVRASFSNYGTALDVMAPGLNVPTASHNDANQYTTGSGTSYAAAHVSGLVSLILSRYPSFTPEEIESTLRSSAVKKGNTLEYGQGLIDMVAALGEVQPAQALTGRIVASATVLPADGVSSAAVTVTVTDKNLPVSGHRLRARIDSGQAQINGVTVDSGVIDLGATDLQGVISFRVSSALPGEKNLFFTDVTTGTELGSLRLLFNPTGPPRYRAVRLAQSSGVTVQVGAEATLWVELKNTGNVPWFGAERTTREQFRLGTYRPADRLSTIYHASWMSANRVATLSQSVINPGEIGRVTFTIKATKVGRYREYFNPVIEYKTWLPDTNIYWDIVVVSSNDSSIAANYQAQLIDRSPDLTLRPGQTGFVSVTFKNIGLAVWSNGSALARGTVKLGTVRPIDRPSLFFVGSWLGPNRAISTGFGVDPGGQLTLGFNVKAPDNPSIYYESFELVAEHITWFGPTVTWKITVI